jgi:TolB-like protein/DNA-binding winged helix-turn-helix (wHTH) protein/thioredoxin-like negative regulator of GroEL
LEVLPKLRKISGKFIAAGMSKQTGHYAFGPYRFGSEERLLEREGKPVPLSPKVVETLHVLLQNAGHLVNKEELLKRVWPGAFVEEGNLNKNIFTLRKTLGQWDSGQEYIETVPKRGYRFIAPVETLSDESPDGEPKEATQNVDRTSPTSRYLKVAAATFGLILAVGGWLVWRIAGRGAVAGTIRSLAVLPLENLSGDAAQDYFADAMTDELITDLGQLGSIRVISRTSIVLYKNARKPLPQIARELDVDAVVEGTVLRSGDHVRITAQLIQARSDRHLWAESYQGEIRDVLGLQSQVARAIAGEIRIKLTPQQQTALKSSRVVSPEAYEAYLRATALAQKGTVDGLQQGIAYFEHALAKQPDYPEGHEGLAKAYIALGHMCALPPQVAFPHAKTEALKALQADQSLADAHESLATVEFLYDWDLPGAEKEFERAILLNPNSINAHARYSDFLNAMGRPDEAIAESVRNQQIDPLSLPAVAGIGWEQYLAGRYDQAIENVRSVLAIDPNDFHARLTLGLALEQKGQFSTAIVELQKATELSNNSIWLNFVAHAKARAGDRAGALRILADLQALSRRTYVTPWSFVHIYAGLGDKEMAFYWLEKCYQRREHDLVFSKVWSTMDGLRSDPRYLDLLRRVGLPQ